MYRSARCAAPSAVCQCVYVAPAQRLCLSNCYSLCAFSVHVHMLAACVAHLRVFCLETLPSSRGAFEWQVVWHRNVEIWCIHVLLFKSSVVSYCDTVCASRWRCYSHSSCDVFNVCVSAECDCGVTTVILCSRSVWQCISAKTVQKTKSGWWSIFCSNLFKQCAGLQCISLRVE